MKIQKAVIPAAGLGTRFLPATKTIPKEMLPIVDKPILLYIVEEIVAAGITDIVLIQGRNKTVIEDFFDKSFELEYTLKDKREDLFRQIQDIREKVNLISIRQKEALGLGHAVLCAQPAIGDQPFAVLLGDEIMFRRDTWRPHGIGQLIEVAQKNSQSAVAVMEVAPSEVSKYGIVAVEETGRNLWKVTDVVEKPALNQAPSRLALPGRYVFDSKIFTYLKETKPGKNGEIQLTDAMAQLAKDPDKGMTATVLDTVRFDAGDKLGYLQANVELGMRHPEIGTAFREYLIKKLGDKP